MSRPRASSASPWVAGSLAFAIAWWLFDLVVLGSGTPDRSDDTWALGAAARALLEGHGFRTPVIPLPLWPLRDAANTAPFLHGPLLPLLLSPFITLFGSDALDAIAWLAAAGAVAVVPPLVRLGERCGHAAIGAGAAVVWTLAPLTLHAVHHDASIPIAAALLVAGLELLARPAPRPLAAGVALGLGALARPELLGALPITALAAGVPGVGGLLLGALAPLLPWGILLAVAGRPPHVDLVVAQTFALHGQALGRALLLPAGALGWLAVLGAAFGIAARETRRVALLTTGLALVPVALLTFTAGDARALVPFLPLYALGAARGLDGLGSWLPAWTRRPRFTIGLLVLVLVPVTGPATREEAVHARDARGVLATERMRLAAWSAALDSTAAWSATPHSTASRFVFSDTPGLVAWTTERSTVGVALTDLRLLPPTGTVLRPARPDSLHTWLHASPP